MEVVSDQNSYRQNASKYPIPVQLTPTWLDAISPGNWNSIQVLDNNSDLLGIMVYSEYQKGPVRIIKMPPLTSYSGPFFFYPDGMKKHRRRSFEKRIMNLILDHLPPVHFYYQQWLPEIDNWLPWMWRNYRQTTLYTYRVPPQDPLNLFSKLRGNVRTDLNRARSVVDITLSQNLNALYDLISMSYVKNKIRVPFSLTDLKSLDATLKKEGRRKIYLGYYQGQAISGIYITYDQDKAYYLTGGVNPDFRGMAAKTLCIWNAIEDAMQKGLIFDFEGSDVPGLEHFFRGWGGHLTPFYKVYKAKNLFYKLTVMMRYKGYY